MGHSGHRHPVGTEGDEAPTGRLLDRGWRYDLEVWFTDTFVLRGKLRQMRRRVLDLAQLESGRAVLDVGCGTGTLAVAAARRVGPTGRVSGVDPAPRQIARARTKAGRAGVQVDFRPEGIENLPFEDGSFDVVLSTLMFHHLPDELRRKGLAELRRVLRPEGRLVLADFDLADSGALLEEAGFTTVSSDQIEFGRTHRGWSGATVLSARRVAQAKGPGLTEPGSLRRTC